MVTQARTLNSQGRNEEAINMLSLVTELRRKVLGSGHPFTEQWQQQG
jgi:hypothetical protein